MDVGAALIKLKPNTWPKVEDWQQQLEQRKVEAIETLQAEGVTVESWFHIQIEGQDYLIAYMRAVDLVKAQQMAKTSPFEIDQVHQQFKRDCWEKVIPAILLLDLDNNEQPRNQITE
ncbi:MULTISPECIES: DUF6176 family protein [Acinetobacter]|uniref:DUF6176 family protein n=1 Tax=Acinetobacter TaxID=469 RepID=UPI00124DADA1|nr:MULTISPECIES: DUF6176 family protein [Acinetobacter]MCU4357442.1 hypothetical protein [Acinetobacter ursingii]MCU4522338.1 hypothetical protein [Acinetobacter ursingii]MEC8056819.1 DUF6176 family protein [Pseudomonadota bacterium]NOZ96741.1 hypothetical protein [Gammaproteobacteria bacterium]